jgi:hypothetical protein
MKCEMAMISPHIPPIYRMGHDDGSPSLMVGRKRAGDKRVIESTGAMTSIGLSPGTCPVPSTRISTK